MTSFVQSLALGSAATVGVGLAFGSVETVMLDAAGGMGLIVAGAAKEAGNRPHLWAGKPRVRPVSTMGGRFR